MPPKRKSNTRGEKTRKTQRILDIPAEELAKNGSRPKLQNSAENTGITLPINKFDLTHINTNKDVAIAEQFLKMMEDFNSQLNGLKFGKPVTYIYNPLIYAKETHEDFVRKYCNSTKKVLFLGMNPGPFGMAQNGVPFGERDHVVNWLKITGHVGKPDREHPKRQIQGLDCPRREVSGYRFWGFWKQMCKTPDRFFRNGFVYNHCPLVFMSDSGKNITPATLPATERRPLNELCDALLIKLLELLQIEIVVGIGKFAADRAQRAIRAESLDNVRVDVILHPSPASPQANKGWDAIVTKQLEGADVLKFFV